MSRRLVNLARKIATPRSAIFAPVRVQQFKFVVPVSHFGTAAGHGSAAHGGKAEPFLDPKIVTTRVIDVIKNFEKVNQAKVTANARFKEDLELDSLDAVEVVMAIEEEFCIEIPDAEADKILSIPDAIAYISNHPMAK